MFTHCLRHVATVPRERAQLKISRRLALINLWKLLLQLHDSRILEGFCFDYKEFEVMIKTDIFWRKCIICTWLLRLSIIDIHDSSKCRQKTLKTAWNSWKLFTDIKTNQWTRENLLLLAKTNKIAKFLSFSCSNYIQFPWITNWLNNFGTKLTIDPELPVVIDRPRSLCVQTT